MSTAGRFLTPGLPARLILATVPAPVGAWLDQWFPGCLGSEFPLCIYYWHPPVMDVLFAFLVLAPFITTSKRWPARLAGLAVVSILVHALAVGQIVNFRGLITIPGVDSIFLDVIPVAVVASLAMALATALIAGFPLSRRLVIGSLLAGLPAAALFLAADTVDVVASLVPDPWFVWALWHVSLAIAIYRGANPARRG